MSSFEGTPGIMYAYLFFINLFILFIILGEYNKTYDSPKCEGKLSFISGNII